MSRRDRGSQRKQAGPGGRAQPQPSAARRKAARGRSAPVPAATRGPGGHSRNRPQPTTARPAQERNRGGPAAPPHFEPKPTDERTLAACLNADRPLRAGEWLWTMREGAERDLVEELLRHRQGATLQPRRLGPALVVSAQAPTDGDARIAITFARQGFQVAHVARADSLTGMASALAPAIADCLRTTQRYALQVFVPDSTQGNLLAGRAEQLAEAIALPPDVERVDDAELRRHGGLLLQICLLSEDTAAIGGIAADRALSLWPGGRARMKLGGDFPSRAARKLAEAFAWLGMAPGSGEVCVDLGAAPGGWSWLLLERRTRVIAVDPARMDPKLMQNGRLTHVQGSAFDFAPDQPVDWLFCDMVWRPHEVAQMLGRWARRRDTRMLVANFKLPMKRKMEMVERIHQLLAASGFGGIRMRQLYHDRDEITLTAHVR